MEEGNRKIEDIKESFQTVEIPEEIDLVIEKAIQKGRRQGVKGRRALGALAAMLVVSTFAGLSFSGIIGKGLTGSEKGDTVVTNTALAELPKIKTFSKLKELVSKNIIYRGTAKDGSMDLSISQAQSSVEKSKSENSYSETNVQVNGVDEGDIVKTDGEFIYRVRTNPNNYGAGAVDIIKAYPAENAAKVATVNVKGNPLELYIKEDLLIILYNGSYGSPIGKGDTKISSYLPEISIQVVSIKDKANPKVVREVSVDGNMVSSRLIGSRLYLISNKYINMGLIEKEEAREDILPSYSDSVNGGKKESLTLDKVGYCPEVTAPNYIMVSSLNLEDLSEKLKVTANLGSGSQVYCSENNLYVSGFSFRRESNIVKDILGIPAKVTNEPNTAVYKFNLKDGEVVFQTSALIPGSIINQFSMDEQGNEFRIATTRNFRDASNKYVMNNNLYILDANMELKGKIENIAEGERIYSTRFIGNRLYMVTFRNVDPLFVIDLGDGKNPKILGQLKIPGFSNYLHPYDENHIIGFGMDTELVGEGTTSERAMTQGMKMAIFDVSDVNNPKQEFVTVIGDRGTYSDILYNHKALLFDKEKELLAIPVQVVEQKSLNENQPRFYQGAYIYKINLTEGFKLRGKISHAGNDMKTEQDYYRLGTNIQRVLYIGNYLYTISNNKVMIHGIQDLNKIGEISY